MLVNVAAFLAAVCTLLLLAPGVSGRQAPPECLRDIPAQSLRYQSQLDVGGCPVRTSIIAGHSQPHRLLAEPVMCVRDKLADASPRQDPVSHLWYVSIPVTLSDEAMASEALRQIGATASTMSFLEVSEVNATVDATSAYAVLDFAWSPGDSVGFLWLGCSAGNANCSACNLASRLRAAQYEILDRVRLSATLVAGGATVQMSYRLLMQNRTRRDSDALPCLPKCQRLQQIRVATLGKCRVPVYKRPDRKGHFVLEPLLCHKAEGLSISAVHYDYSGDPAMYYINVEIALEDSAALAEAREQLADLAPLNVEFMQLLRAQSRVSPALSRRILIGPLSVSRDGRLALMRMHCRAASDCLEIRNLMTTNPNDVWRHIRWTLTSATVSANCSHESRMRQFAGRMPAPASLVHRASNCSGSKWSELCPLGPPCKYQRTSDGRSFLVIQQRLAGSVSFQQNWTEYETGFGDETDFWIGLHSMNKFTQSGATLRVEMKLTNGTDLHVEYSDFRVADPSTGYRMTYQAMLTSRSSAGLAHFDAMAHSMGMSFATTDRDNARACSAILGDRGGWWYRNCQRGNPNALFSAERCGGPATSATCMYWRSSEGDSGWLALRQIRLLIEL